MPVACSIAISAIAVMIFSLYLLYDVSSIVRGGQTNYIMATLALFLDIFNIFVNLLNLLLIFTGQRDCKRAQAVRRAARAALFCPSDPRSSLEQSYRLDMSGMREHVGDARGAQHETLTPVSTAASRASVAALHDTYTTRETCAGSDLDQGDRALPRRIDRGLVQRPEAGNALGGGLEQIADHEARTVGERVRRRVRFRPPHRR